MTLAQLRRRLILGTAALAAAALAAVPANATLTISNGATKNVSCSAGVCAATAKNAVLNAGDLAGMLASSDVAVQSTSKAKDIELKVALSFASASQLTLDAYQSITFDKPLTVAGSGGPTLTTNDGGSGGELSFVAPGRIVFWDLSSSLVIDGASYTLVGDIATLASDIAADPAGHYALANNYDASVDGTYSAVPIPTRFTGTLNGLGNEISKLDIFDNNAPDVGLFADIAGTIESIGIVDSQVASIRTSLIHIGLLAGVSEGSILQSFTSGTVAGPTSDAAGGLIGVFFGSIAKSRSMAAVNGQRIAGGLIGYGFGTISDCYATGSVAAAVVGGIAGEFGDSNLHGTISRSFSTGDVTSRNSTLEKETAAGGLVGINAGMIVNSYSTGNALIKKPYRDASFVGGLVGHNYSFASISMSYSTGVPSPGRNAGSLVGGLVGKDESSGGLNDTYWDTTTSGIADLSQGAGNILNDPGITGLTTQQLQSGLPAGFSPATWAEDPNINGGLPYLLSNPPQ